MGGKFKTNTTIFEKLEKVGIKVPESDRYDKFISTYDCKAFQVPDNEVGHGRRIHYLHIPISYSVCSNIPGHNEPVHKTSDGNPQKVVHSMVELQLEHQETASAIMREKFDWVFLELQLKLNNLEKLESEKGKRIFQKN